MEAFYTQHNTAQHSTAQRSTAQHSTPHHATPHHVTPHHTTPLHTTSRIRLFLELRQNYAGEKMMGQRFYLVGTMVEFTHLDPEVLGLNPTGCMTSYLLY